MAVRKVLIWPDSMLKRESAPVSMAEAASESFRTLVADMFDTMYANRGVGLAAIQVGVPQRVFVMDAFGDPSGRTKHVFVNPAIQDTFGDLVEVEEGCLSLPGFVERKKRYPELIILDAVWSMPTSPDVVVEGEWPPVRYQLDGLEAQIAQHEIEHLDGVTLADGAGTAKRDAIRRKIQKTLRERNR